MALLGTVNFPDKEWTQVPCAGVLGMFSGYQRPQTLLALIACMWFVCVVRGDFADSRLVNTIPSRQDGDWCNGLIQQMDSGNLLFRKQAGYGHTFTLYDPGNSRGSHMEEVRQFCIGWSFGAGLPDSSNVHWCELCGRGSRTSKSMFPYEMLAPKTWDQISGLVVPSVTIFVMDVVMCRYFAIECGKDETVDVDGLTASMAPPVKAQGSIARLHSCPSYDATFVRPLPGTCPSDTSVGGDLVETLIPNNALPRSHDAGLLPVAYYDHGRFVSRRYSWPC